MAGKDKTMVSASDDLLSQEKHARIFERSILGLMRNASPAEHPRAILIAGQPGSGKSALAKKATKELNNNVVIIDPDLLRGYHPRYFRHLREDSMNAADKVHRDASAWAKELRAAAISQRRNIIVDGTLGNPERAAALCQELREQGYHVEVRAMAVNGELSRQGIIARYERGLARQHIAKWTAPRWTPEAVHDEAYNGMPRSIEIIENSKLADKVRIYARTGKELHNAQGKQSARVLLETERNRPLNAYRRYRTDARWNDIKQLRQSRGADTQDIDITIARSRTESRSAGKTVETGKTAVLAKTR
jgi:predicted ABC-type ATPase